MKRVAVLGATGSIGRQALEVIDRHRELELVAASSGSQPIDGLAPLTQVGGDLTELLERARPDVVLNAVVGFAGVTATLWTLESVVEAGSCLSTASIRRSSSASRNARRARSTPSSSPPPADRSAGATA